MSENKKRGIILMNLGSPDSTEVPDVKRYLDEFLMDEKVIDYSWLFRALLVKGIIVPFRAAKSAEAYQTIWSKNGSPLIHLTYELRDALQQQIPEPVVVAMRYGKPSPKDAFDELMQKVPQLEEVIGVPLYPHFAMSSYETAVDYAKEIHQKNNYPFTLNFIKPFYNDDAYLQSLSENMRPYLEQDYDHILFSYHGVPARHIKKSDITGEHCLQVADCCNVPSPAHKFCYRHQCFDTTKNVVERLQIPKDKYSNSFQSRLGKGWLQPFTDKRLEEMPAEGIKKLLVVCPAFTSDCLETLEEIAIRGKETFLQAGGETFAMIPCLNIHPLWVSALKRWVQDNGENSKMLLKNY
jgi:protoporphyrin/coproporphyrin ferrochelatase